MAKHKKTRREKKAADGRHSLYHLETEVAQVDPPIAKKETPNQKLQSSIPQITVSYAYVTKDIRKILLVTSIIIIAQLVIFFIFNRV